MVKTLNFMLFHHNLKNNILNFIIFLFIEIYHENKISEWMMDQCRDS